jgi:hypothetical protein
MARSCMQSSTCAVKLMKIVKLLNWLTDAHMSQVHLDGHTGADDGIGTGTP